MFTCTFIFYIFQDGELPRNPPDFSKHCYLQGKWSLTRCPYFIGTAGFPQHENDIQTRRHRAVCVSQKLNCCEQNLNLSYWISLKKRQLLFCLWELVMRDSSRFVSFAAFQMMVLLIPCLSYHQDWGMTDLIVKVRTLAVAKEHTWERIKMDSFIQRRNPVRKKGPGNVLLDK